MIKVWLNHASFKEVNQACHTKDASVRWCEYLFAILFNLALSRCLWYTINQVWAYLEVKLDHTNKRALYLKLNGITTIPQKPPDCFSTALHAGSTVSLDCYHSFRRLDTLHVQLFVFIATPAEITQLHINRSRTAVSAVYVHLVVKITCWILARNDIRPMIFKPRHFYYNDNLDSTLARNSCKAWAKTNIATRVRTATSRIRLAL